ncbi:MAG TPA: SDR family oxidoreductase [Casimicrobiaceae bacterium]
MNAAPAHSAPRLDDALVLRGKNALITGASLGIGSAIARLFATRGAAIAVHYASQVDAGLGYPDAGKALTDELRASGATALAIDVDLAEDGAATQIMTAVNAAWDSIDILVLCASVQVRQPLAAVDAHTLAIQRRINFDATFELLQAVLPSMAERRFGRVISIGSVNQVRPHADLSIYAALKAAQHNLIVGIAKQYAANGITANTISPGLITTPRNEWRRRDAAEWAHIQRSANPMHRAGTPDEVAQIAGLLAAHASAFITGADIAVDGGGRL